MRDRIPSTGKANRVKITQDNGNVVEGILEYADEPTQVGSTLALLYVLPDTLCNSLGIDNETSEPKDAFNVTYGKVGDIKTTVRTDLGDEWLLCNGEHISKNDYPEIIGTLQNINKLDMQYSNAIGLGSREYDNGATLYYIDGCWAVVTGSGSHSHGRTQFYLSDKNTLPSSGMYHAIISDAVTPSGGGGLIKTGQYWATTTCSSNSAGYIGYLTYISDSAMRDTAYSPAKKNYQHNTIFNRAQSLSELYNILYYQYTDSIKIIGTLGSKICVWTGTTVTDDFDKEEITTTATGPYYSTTDGAYIAIACNSSKLLVYHPTTGWVEKSLPTSLSPEQLKYQNGIWFFCCGSSLYTTADITGTWAEHSLRTSDTNIFIAVYDIHYADNNWYIVGQLDTSSDTPVIAIISDDFNKVLFYKSYNISDKYFVCMAANDDGIIWAHYNATGTDNLMTKYIDLNKLPEISSDHSYTYIRAKGETV